MYSNPPMDYHFHTPSYHPWSIPPTYPTNHSSTFPTTPSFPSFPWELFTPCYTHVGSSSPKLYLNHGYSPHTPNPNPYSSYSSSPYSYDYNNYHQLQPTKISYKIRKDFEKHLQVSHPSFKKYSQKISKISLTKSKSTNSRLKTIKSGSYYASPSSNFITLAVSSSRNLPSLSSYPLSSSKSEKGNKNPSSTLPFQKGNFHTGIKDLTQLNNSKQQYLEGESRGKAITEEPWAVSKGSVAETKKVDVLEREGVIRHNGLASDVDNVHVTDTVAEDLTIASRDGGSDKETVVVDRENEFSTVCRWTVNNFSKVKARALWSKYFEVGGYYCRLLIYPKSYSQALPGYISVYLQIKDPSRNSSSKWDCSASYLLEIVNVVDNSKIVHRDSWHRFTAKKKSHGPGLGYVCVRNRIGNESYEEARDEEQKFIESHSQEEINKVMDSAKSAHKSWAKTPLWIIAELLHKATAILKEHKAAIAECLVKEITKQAKDLFTEVVRSGDLVSYCAEEGMRILGEGIFLVSDRFLGNERTKYCITSKIPIGVILTIPPFNHTINLAVSKIAHALIAGNSIVLQPPTTVLFTKDGDQHNTKTNARQGASREIEEKENWRKTRHLLTYITQLSLNISNTLENGGNSLPSDSDGVKKKISYFYDSEVGNHYYGHGHPMKPHCIRMTHALLAHYGLLQHMQVIKSTIAKDRDLYKFHADDYVVFLRGITPETYQDQLRQLKRFNVGEDYPIFDGVYSFCQMYAGGSVSGALKLNPGVSDIAINWAGGLHHPKKCEASGFCYVNDIVLAILELLKIHERVLYVDIDIHRAECVKYIRSCNFPLLFLGGGEWFIVRVFLCGLFHIAYPTAPEATKTKLRSIYSQLCQDDMPMVRRSAATSLGKFLQLIATFIGGFVIAFTKGWLLTLVTQWDPGTISPLSYLFSNLEDKVHVNPAAMIGRLIE